MLGNRVVSQKLIDLGNYIREKRQCAGMSQERLAEKSGLSPNTVSRIEGGQMAMSMETFRKIVKALGLDANVLLGATELTEGDEEELQGLFCRMRYLKQRERKVVLETVTALIDALEKF